MTLSKYEQETIINYNASDPLASIYTREKATMRVIDRLVAAYPDIYKLEEQDDISKTYSVPKSYINYRKPRKLTAEQREQKQKLMERINNNDNKHSK